ncbi:MAG: hypothetical protein EPN93_07670 [Spirochaetes bacterium]|nr:MAG: hypothetical protein EPN93_07670 [Spirochaetota bacterium]
MKRKTSIESIVRIVDRDDDAADLRYWLGKTPEERIEAVILLREQYMRSIGYDKEPEVEPIVTFIFT